jgi:hypothetical protein
MKQETGSRYDRIGAGFLSRLLRFAGLEFRCFGYVRRCPVAGDQIVGTKLNVSRGVLIASAEPGFFMEQSRDSSCAAREQT